MLANINKKLKKKLGFSLVEMLVVIAVIAILVAIIMPIVANSRQKAAAATNAANLRAIEGKISVMRVENPQIFEDTLTKEGHSEDQFSSYLDNAGFDEFTRHWLWLQLKADSDSAAAKYYTYHIYHNTATEDGVITISVDPQVIVTDVPASEEVRVDNMILPEGVPMTVYISDTAIVASYEYGGNSYTKDDFAYVAENGKFDRDASGGLTGEELENALNCSGGKHAFSDGSCVCIHCGNTYHAGYEPAGATGHACSRCGDSGTHSFVLGTCITCGYSCDHDWSTTGTHHICSLCGTNETHNFVLGFCATCLYTCDHNWTKTATNHSCSVCGTNEGHSFVGGICYTCTYTCSHSWTKTSSSHSCSKCGTSGSHSYVANVCTACFYSKPGPCVTPDTFVTMADGTMKTVADLVYGDELLVWNFYTGSYDVAPVSLIINHGYGDQEIIVLKFNDGTSINFVNVHSAFDADLNNFVDINAANVASFVGHDFVKMTKNGYTTVELIGYEVKHEYNGAISLLSHTHYNAILNGMLTISPSLDAGSLYEPFEVSAGMKYDAAQVQKDIETYGQYTYEDFSDYVTYEQFEAFDLANAKVSVGKGHTTFEAILKMFQSFAVPFL